jgi:ApbE superfamily uncharacterized protein (UPF0280 family)
MMLFSDIEASPVFSAARSAVLHSRNILENYISSHPEFLTSLEPLEIDLLAPEFIRSMQRAGLAANVGPMASVAGGLAEVATSTMLTHGCKFAMANNGGDISLMGQLGTVVGIYAGERSVANLVGLKIKPIDLPLGVCTSAGVLGHSLSFGSADAVVVFAKSAFLSDASATAIANYVKKTDPEGTIQNALELAENIEGVLGCIIFIGEEIGTTGWVPEMVEIIDGKETG